MSNNITEFNNYNEDAVTDFNQLLFPILKSVIYDIDYGFHIGLFLFNVIVNGINGKMSTINIIKRYTVLHIKSVISTISLIICFFMICMYGVDYYDKNVMFEIFLNNNGNFICIAYYIIGSFSCEKSLINNAARFFEFFITLHVIMAFSYGCSFVLNVMLYGYTG